MTTRFITAASILALVSACSSQPASPPVSATDQGFTAFRSGNFAAAEQAYAAALSANPGNEAAMLGLAEVYEQTGRGQEAAALYAQLHASRSGAIRVWNDGRAMQDGVREVAGRRLGALGHGAVVTHSTMTEFQAPAYAQPMPHAAPVATDYLPDNPTYALDEDGIVYYADPEATQPITDIVFEAPQAAQMIATPQMISAPQAIKYIPAAPIMPAPMPVRTGIIYQDSPVVQPVDVVVPNQAEAMMYQPAPMMYQQAPITAPASPEATRYEAAPMSFEAAPAPVTYEAEPIAYTPAPVAPTRYEPAPMPVAPAPRMIERAPIAQPVAPAFSPMPTASRNTAPSGPAQPLPRTQPGYAVINGDLVYISAEDIAKGSIGQGAQGPIGGEVMNGIKIPNLN